MKTIGIICVILLASVLGFSQQAECPSGMVCLTPAAARAALEAGDAKVALEKQVAVLEQALKDSQLGEHKMALEFSRVSGENTILKLQQIRDMALVDLALKQTKKKRNGFITFF